MPTMAKQTFPINYRASTAELHALDQFCAQEQAKDPYRRYHRSHAIRKFIREGLTREGFAYVDADNGEDVEDNVEA